MLGIVFVGAVHFFGGEIVIMLVSVIAIMALALIIIGPTGIVRLIIDGLDMLTELIHGSRNKPR